MKINGGIQGPGASCVLSAGHEKNDEQQGSMNLTFESSKKGEVCLYDHEFVILF